jgi:hypothetical protein
MKALEELTADIREKLPRLKIIESGQEIKALINDSSRLIEKGEKFIIGKDDCYVYAGKAIGMSGYIYDVGNDFEIIGKDPMLNDVLEWFKYSDMEDGINRMYEWIWIDTVKEILNLWDLSKPYLKDQSPELINFLHGLINH